MGGGACKTQKIPNSESAVNLGFQKISSPNQQKDLHKRQLSHSQQKAKSQTNLRRAQDLSSRQKFNEQKVENNEEYELIKQIQVQRRQSRLQNIETQMQIIQVSQNNLLQPSKNVFTPFIKNESQATFELHDKQKNKIVVKGLLNIGNTCYMNASLQVLFHCPIITEIFLNGSYKKQVKSKNSQIISAFTSLLRNSRSSTDIQAQDPSCLKDHIETLFPQFTGFQQQDAQEFLLSLLQGMHQELNRVNKKSKYKELQADLSKKSLQQISEDWHNYYKSLEDSLINDFFNGQLLNKVACGQCKNQSIAFDNFFDISLSFSRSHQKLQSIDLSTLIQQFLMEELLEDQFYCAKCSKHTKSFRKFDIWRLPQILILHLKRFHFGKIRREKILTKIIFPIDNLDMSQYINKSKDPSTKNSQYFLFGIIEHLGSLYKGHYIAECKNPVNGQWYIFNDSQVEEINIYEQCHDTQGSTEPYILLYCKYPEYQHTKNAKF